MAAERTAEAPRRRGGSTLEAVAGLAVALVLAPVLVLSLPQLLPGDIGTLAGLAALWLLAAGIAFATVRIERRGWAGLGVVRTRARTLLLAGALGVVLLLLVPALSLVAGMVLPTGGGDVAAAGARPGLIVLAAVLTAAVTEEVLFRAYPIERLAALTGSPWPGVVLGTIAFTVLHAGSWSPAHVIGVVLPLGALLALIYVWRRNLLVVIVAHLITDAPLIILAFAG
ncbi:CPBP family intramembrane glutamic endopeptidase [Microbacterium sp. RD1]|uniref:CPBP family intramembrane glutamic endopeptidase n=1 Tax=Microbacterium sp. RD1 TaxID=3457313 RepID=UPI003FA5CB32